jgi:hypothetical protein
MPVTTETNSRRSLDGKNFLEVVSMEEIVEEEVKTKDAP